MSESKQFEVRESADLGRYLVAAKDFNVGDLILDEAPLLLAPTSVQTQKLFKQEENVMEGTLTCLVCYKLIPPEVEMKICHKCSWPVCSVECADCEESLHKKFECKVLASKQIQVIPMVLRHIYLIRAVLMHKDKENRQPWEQFLTLTSTLSLFHGDFKDRIMEEIKFATRFLNDICKLDVDTDTVGLIVRTSLLNAFGSQEKDEHGSLYQAEAIFKTGSLFAHSCSPNADWVVIPTNHNDIERWHLRIYARRKISCNETICIPYVYDCLTLDTPSRQKLIAQYFHFDCLCLRCLDPTEFSFYTSAVVCSYCGDKCLTPDYPSDDHSPWTCTHCGNVKDHILASLYVESFEKSLTAATDHEGVTSVREVGYDTLIRTGQGNSGLNPNHRLIIRAMWYWLQVQTYQDLAEHSEKSKDKFITIMTRATQCLKVFRMFGVLYRIVPIESSMAYAIAAYYFKTKDMASVNYDNYDPETKLKILTAVYTHLKIAVNIMEWHPFNTAYDHLRNHLRINFKFWKDQLNTLTEVLHGDSNELVETGDTESSNLPSALKPKNLPVSFIRVLSSPFLDLSSRNPGDQGTEDSEETVSVVLLTGTEDVPGIVLTSSPSETDMFDLIEAHVAYESNSAFSKLSVGLPSDYWSPPEIKFLPICVLPPPCFPPPCHFRQLASFERRSQHGKTIPPGCLSFCRNDVAACDADVKSVPILTKLTEEMSETNESSSPFKPDTSLLETLDFYYHL